MKKFLSLVLALVMTASLVTVSAGAKEFKDDKDVTYDEAVAVISEIGVVDGDTDGNFRPTDNLSRGAAAKIICNLILGPTTAAELKADTAPYKDVPVSNVFSGYIAYCAKEGIISGYADGSFRPAGTLTGYAFMKMLLGALGYDGAYEGYTGANWSINVAKQAIGIGLNKSLTDEFNGVDFVTREEAALYAFNTLKATLVDYENKITANVNGADVTISNTTAKPVNWAEGINHDGNIKDDNFVQFAEEYFPKLEVNAVEDAFGRPCREWEYDGEKIGTFVNHDLLVESYTVEVTGKDLFDLLGKNVVDNYKFHVYIDGVDNVKENGKLFNETALNKNNKAGVGATGNGVLTEVYLDSESKDVTIAIINTYLAKATANYNDKTELATFNVYDLANVGSSASPVYVKTENTEANKDVDNKVTMKVSNDDFAVSEIVEDDFRLVTVAEGEIQSVEDVEVLEDTTLTSFTVGKKVVADGETYNYASTAEYDYEVLDKWTSVDGATNLKDLSYNLYLDQYGYLIGVDLVEVPNNYLFLTGIDGNNSNLSAVAADAFALFLDGTSKSIKVNLTKSTLDTSGNNDAILNTWCTYTVNKDGVYTVKEVASAIDLDSKPAVKIAQWDDSANKAATHEIDVKHVNLPGAASGNYSNVYGNDNTVYLNAELSAIVNKDSNTPTIIISGVESSTTGVKAANLSSYNENTVMGLKKSDSNATVWNAVTTGNASYGVYTLYKSNGYIIGSVVVGKDEAAAKNLVFVNSSDVETEGYSEENDEWTWERLVVFNGEETKLKERGDSLSYLNHMTQYGWYQVKLDAEGYVIGVDPASAVLVGTPTKYVNNINNVPAAVATPGMDTVLYQQTFSNESKVPQLVGATLHVTTTSSTGFFVKEDVKIVLIQKNDNVTKTSYETGVSNLENVLATLNKAKDDGYYDYTISAMIEGGGATVVVIEDIINDPTGNAGTKPTDPTNLNIDLDNLSKVVVHTTKTAAEYPMSAAANDITKKLLANGWTLVGDPTFDGTDTYRWTVKKPGDTFNTPVVFDAGTDLHYGSPVVTLNGQSIVFTGTRTALLADQGLEDSGKSYLKVKNAAGTVAFVLSNDVTALANGDVLTTGYLKVTVNGNAPDGTDLSLGNLEKSGSDYYALKTATIQKGSAATGTGVKVGTDGYMPYGAAYGDVDAATGDGTVDGTAAIAAVGQVKVTVLDMTVGAATPKKEYAEAYSASATTVNAMAVSGSAVEAMGTSVKIDNGSFVADTSAITLDRDHVVEAGYVQVKDPTWTPLGSGMDVKWDKNVNDYVPVGSVVTATVRLPSTGIVGTATSKLTATGATTIVGTADVTGATTSAWSAGVYTFASGETVKGTLTVKFTTEATGDFTGSLVYTA